MAQTVISWLINPFKDFSLHSQLSHAILILMRRSEKFDWFVTRVMSVIGYSECGKSSSVPIMTKVMSVEMVRRMKKIVDRTDEYLTVEMVRMMKTIVDGTDMANCACRN